MSHIRKIVSIDPERRSRSPRDSAERRELFNSAARPIQRSEGARIQSRCLHQIVGIAPIPLLFHAECKSWALLPLMTKRHVESSRLTKKSVTRASLSLIKARDWSANGIYPKQRRQDVMTNMAFMSAAVRTEVF